MTIDASIQAQVDAQLMEQGAYTTLELLINTGRLGYGDYESWRRGEIEYLDDVLMGVKEKIRAQIEQAASYAKSIGLIEQKQELYRWSETPGTSTKPLRASVDEGLNRLIAARFAPAEAAPQMDLFFDNPIVTLTNGIAHALAARNLEEAQRQLDRLYAQAPNHADLGAFDRLTAALARLNQPVVDTGEMLESLLDITPTARRLLGSQYRDLLAPLWRHLAAALTGEPYSSETPNLHSSFASARAQDWAAVEASVLAEPDWQRHAPLCLRLAHAGFYRQQRFQMLAAWFQLCWHHPQRAAQALDTEQLDAGLATAWTQFQDSDHGPLFEHDAVPATADFPAWMVLHEPGLAQHLPVDLPIGHTPGEEHYRQIHRWVHARRAHQHDGELALRKAIQATSPFLFERLKQMVKA